MNAPRLYLEHVPAARGIAWAREGLQVFRTHPLALASLFFASLLAGMLLSLLPGVGLVLWLALLPLVSLGFMLATARLTGVGEPAHPGPGARADPLAGSPRVTPAVFIEPLRTDTRRRVAQWQLGLVYAMGMVAVTLLAQAIDGGRYAQLGQILTTQPVDEPAARALLQEPALFWGMAARLGGAALLSVPLWHAPALVHWGGQGAWQALFSSTLGVWRNRGAFVLNGLVWMGLTLAASFVLSLLLVVPGVMLIAPMLMMALGCMLATAFYASLLTIFRDCFRIETSSS